MPPDMMQPGMPPQAMAPEGGEALGQIGQVIQQMIAIAGPEQVLQFLTSAMQSASQPEMPPQGAPMPPQGRTVGKPRMM